MPDPEHLPPAALSGVDPVFGYDSAEGKKGELDCGLRGGKTWVCRPFTESRCSRLIQSAKVIRRI